MNALRHGWCQTIRTHAPLQSPLRRIYLTRPRSSPLRWSGVTATQICPESTRAPNPLTDATPSPPSQTADKIAARKAQQPAYQLQFTCRKCLHRSAHHVTKQAYHHGTTLVTCPECKNRHLISDHLKIFSDKRVTIEDLLREKGQYLRKGRLGEDGDIEFYDEDGKEGT